MRAIGRLLGLASLLVVAAAAPLYASMHLLVITGVGGDEADAAQFSKWASALVDAAVSHGVAAGDVTWLGDGHDPRVRGRSTRENVTKAFDDLATAAGPDDEVVVVLIGHGSFDGRTATFNLPGPDLNATDYAALLHKLRSQHVAFVNTSAASGAFVEPLAGPGRAIVTATSSGGERNDTRFPAYFVEAFTSDAADRDHDGRVSVLEAFDYAKAKVADAYKREGLLQAEHARIEDGAGGAFASTIALGGTAPAAAAPAPSDDPALRALIEERHQIELRVAALRQRKGSMDEREYDAELEKLLVELATKTRAIQQRQGKP